MARKKILDRDCLGIAFEGLSREYRKHSIRLYLQKSISGAVAESYECETLFGIEPFDGGVGGRAFVIDRAMAGTIFVEYVRQFASTRPWTLNFLKLALPAVLKFQPYRRPLWHA